jgi:hypothetical protein
MAQRGRKSASSLSVIQALPGQQRPEPPNELRAEEAEEWRAVVGRLPWDWFPRECHGLLVNYCRHVVRGRMIAKLIHDFDPEWVATDEGLRRLDKLTTMAERESRTVASLGTKMRITQQSRYAHKTAYNKAADASEAKKPWQQKVA